MTNNMTVDYLVVGAGAMGMAFVDALPDRNRRNYGNSWPMKSTRWTLEYLVPACTPAPAACVLWG